MGKRPFYLISHVIDCDGYYTYHDYLGVNAQAALERFKYLASEIRDRYFLNEGVDEEHIYYGRDQRWEDIINLTTDIIDAPGKAFTIYMNDDNCCWINIKISVVETGEFFHYPRGTHNWDDGTTVYSDNMQREEFYKNAHPNAKY